MAPIEKRDISSLPEGEKDNYKNIDELKSSIDLKNEINDNLFSKLENGNAVIERHNGNLIFKVKDRNSRAASMVNINGENFGGYSFRVKEKTLKNFLEKEQNTTETSAHYNALLNKLLVVKNTQNELTTMRQNLNFNSNVTKENVGSTLNSLIWYYNDINNHRSPRTYSKDSRQGFKELKNKARARYGLLKNIKYDLERRSYSDITQYIEKINKYLKETQEFDHNWQKIVMKQYPGNISIDINNTTDAKNERKYQEGKFAKNNKFNNDLENAEILDESNETMKTMQQELINDLSDTKNLINNSDQIGKRRIISQMNEFENTVKKVKSMKELRIAMVGVIYQIEELEKKSIYKNKVKEKIKLKIGGLKIKYKRKLKYSTTKQDMISNGSYQTMKKTCKRNGGASGMLNNMLVDGLSQMGLIDKNNAKQVEAVKKGGQFVQVAGMLVLGFKFLQNLFSKKGANKNKRGKTAGYGAALFGLFNADKLMNWGKDIYGGGGKTGSGNTIETSKVSDSLNTDQETVSTYITPPYTTLAAIGGIPINTLTNPTLELISEDNGRFEIDYKKYESYLNSPKTKIDKDAKAAALANLKILEENGGDMLNDGLNKLGINSIDDMKKISGKNNKKTLLDSDNVVKYINDVSLPVNKDLAEEGLKPRNAKAWYEITQEFDETKTDNDVQIAKWIKRGLLVSKESVAYSLDKMANDNNLDLVNKKINGLNLEFETYDELFKAKTLTDFIKEEFKNKTAKSKKPFHVDLTTGNIQFDNVERYKVWENETDVVNANFYKDSLENISETLSDKKDIYVDYLNTQWTQN